MFIGYTRPYSSDLDCEKQYNLLTKLNCEMIIREEHSSSNKRIKLEYMINNISQGDKVIVAKLLVLADSAHHLVELLNTIEEKGAYFQSLKEGIDTSKDRKNSFKHIVKHIVDFQSDLISEKTKLGINEAKQKGILPGRPRIPDENVRRAIAMYQSKKYSISQIKAETGISKSTLYRYLGK